MARKRKLDATISADIIDEPEEQAPRGAMGGMWAGSAMNLLQQRIDDTHGSLVQGIMNGTVALELNPDQIRDTVGSDRVTDWRSDEDFAGLVANIKRRGQTQAVRVRPANADWSPNPDAPLDVSGAEFIVQSGRRRIEACRQLGRPVLAILSTDAGDAALADLEERFHENTMRKNLNGFEELLSIGLIAESLQDLTQEEIAERLSIAQGDVSQGVTCLELREAILEQVDVANTPKRAYRGLLPKIRRGVPLGPRPKPQRPTGSYRRKDLGVTVESDKGRLMVRIEGARTDRIDLDDIAQKVGRLFN